MPQEEDDVEKEPEPKPEETSSQTRKEPRKKMQTAEGWKRSLMKIREEKQKKARARRK